MRAATIPWTVSGSALHAPARLEHAHELLGVQRISGGPLDERLLDLGLEQRAVEQREHEPCDVASSVERRERDRGRVPLAPSPPGTAVEQLRPRGADDEQRDAVHPVDQPVDEVEQPVVGPVQILEDEHARPALGDGLEEAAPRGERLAAAIAARSSSSLSPTSGRRCRATHARSPSSRARGRRGELLLGHLGGVRLEHPGLRLHDLAERPERDALAVRQPAPLAPHDELVVLVHGAAELVARAGSCRSRDADERHELRRALAAAARERVDEEVELASRPTRRARPAPPRSTPSRERASTASQTGTGAAFPLASTGSASR